MKPSQKRSRPESVLVAALILCIDAYKTVLSPFFLGSCRFEPSCSQYAREALVKHGDPRTAVADFIAAGS